MNKKIEIYNLTFLITVEEKLSKAIKAINNQFWEYKESKEDPDITINIYKYYNNKEFISQNPSCHRSYKTGFEADYGKFSVSYIKNDKETIFDLHIKESGSGAINYLKKLNNIQYNNVEERICQILYETCIYPAIFMRDDYCLIHSSGFSYKDKEAILLGGTGGVGKTSLELEISKSNDFGFLNDDIAILQDDGNIHPNLAWPKIYGYNLKNNKHVKKAIFKNRTLDDRFAWFLKQIIWGTNKVRRIISPDILFKRKTSTNPLPFKKYIFLCKGNYSKLQLRKINTEKIPEINISIINSEFSGFINHLNWHKYNSFINSMSPIVTIDEMESRSLSLQKDIFRNVDSYVLEIPMNISHEIFKKTASELIFSLF